MTNDPALLSTEALAAKLGSHDLRAVELRPAEAGGREAYEAAHVPGSVLADYAADGWRAREGAAPGMLPPAEHLSALFARLGIRPHDHVVVVPAGTSSGEFAAAARVLWTLRVAGHARLSILDGGFAAWRDEGRPVEAGASVERIAGPYPVALKPEFRATLGQVEAAVKDGSATLVDSRGPASFAGDEKSEHAARAGRLPGAVMVEGAAAYDPATGRLRPRQDLDRLFTPVPAGATTAYCNTGQAAATDWFILSEVMGRRGVSLYDGSMSQWTEDPARPVETGRGAAA